MSAFDEPDWSQYDQTSERRVDLPGNRNFFSHKLKNVIHLST